MAFLPFLGMIALYPPAVTLLAVAGVVGVSQIVVRRNEFLRAIYNMAQAAITAGAASYTFHSLAGSGLNFAAAFSLAAVVFFVTNILLTGLAIAYLKSVQLTGVLSHIASGLRYDFLASPIAAFPVMLYDSFEYSILVVIFPLLLVHYFHLSKQQLSDAHTDLIRALVTAIETRDPYTSGHSERVATLATLIAKDLGIPAGRVRTIENAALLHDIGKIDPAFAEVLSKPFELTVEERALIQTHAARGAQMLEGMKSVDSEVVRAVLHHHERYDGKGYPAGMAGDDIPMPARIIMLCDSVDAMLSDRPYRQALSLSEVHEELRQCAGSQFDPQIVRGLLEHDTLTRAMSLLSEDHELPSDATHSGRRAAS
jgi:putative nucleotidyltransferase with HDIG domain